MCGLVSLLLHAVCLSALIFGVVAMHVYVGVQLHFYISGAATKTNPVGTHSKASHLGDVYICGLDPSTGSASSHLSSSD